MRDENIVKKAHDFSGLSARDFARKIGANLGSLNEMRAGRRAIPPWIAAKCAEIIGENWVLEVAKTAKEQARSEAEKQFWKEKLESLKQTAAVAAVGFLLSVGSPSVEASHGVEGNRTNHVIHSAYLPI